MFSSRRPSIFARRKHRDWFIKHAQCPPGRRVKNYCWPTSPRAHFTTSAHCCSRAHNFVTFYSNLDQIQQEITIMTIMDFTALEALQHWTHYLFSPVATCVTDGSVAASLRQTAPQTNTEHSLSNVGKVSWLGFELPTLQLLDKPHPSYRPQSLTINI